MTRVVDGDAPDESSHQVMLPRTMHRGKSERVYVIQIITEADHGLEGMQSSHSIPITLFDIHIRR